MISDIKKFFKRLYKASKYIINGTANVKAEYNFTSNIEITKLKRGEWVFVSTNILINEFGDHWLEDTHILCNMKDKRKLFAGELSNLKLTKQK